ncbi:hypothetical protein LSH36_175g04051 [Paralvinella palmiformis]|uniref:Mitochondrial potassium channel ATP-binding subunit n=1 Tax=Paralvinella palmiformis TaxID=53620 RepID=A0AAD9JRT3_9ANNE|nr:hypothetical protein LSH36_175g04051 [Paralvinella palmiformis]
MSAILALSSRSWCCGAGHKLSTVVHGQALFCSRRSIQLGLSANVDSKRLYLPSWIKHFVNCVKPRNKSLHQRHFSLKGNIKQTPSRLLVLTLGSGCVGVVTFIRTFSNHAHCEYKPKNRLSAYEETGNIPEPKLPWKEFFKLLLPDIWYLIGAILSALAVAILNIQIPLMLGDVVNILTKYTTESNGDFVQDIKAPALKLCYLYGFQGLLTFVYISLLGSLGERVATRLRKRLFESIITQDIAFFDTHKTGEIVNRLTTDVQDFKSSFKLVISQGLRSLTQTLGCIASLFIISPKMTTIMVIVVPTIIGLGSLIGSVLRTLSRKAQAQVSKATAVADEAIGNVRTVRAFAMEPKETELYNREVEQAAKLNQLLNVSIGAFQGLASVALNGIALGTLYVGGLLMSRNELKPGDLMSFMVAVQTIQRSLAQMSLLFGQAVRGLSAGARVFEYIQLKPLMPMTGGLTIPYHTMKGSIEFNGVTFTYPNRPNQVVLKDFSLKIPGGRIVALVGLSGGGKSTVAGLLERFYDVENGSITVDGINIKDLDPSWLRGRAIGYINQEPVLFATSVLENIRYGCPGATDEEVKEAAKLANAHDFITSFPDGYNTVLGERGVTVSGGQKQRIAIARALIKHPSILILDEATSALDAESERVVQEALDKIIKGRTVLVIAHRLSTIRDADVIAVMSNGVIAEIGKHEELKKKHGIYWELIKEQEKGVHQQEGFFTRQQG